MENINNNKEDIQYSYKLTSREFRNIKSLIAYSLIIITIIMSFYVYHIKAAFSDPFRFYLMLSLLAVISVAFFFLTIAGKVYLSINVFIVSLSIVSFMIIFITDVSKSLFSYLGIIYILPVFVAGISVFSSRRILQIIVLFFLVANTIYFAIFKSKLGLIDYNMFLHGYLFSSLSITVVYITSLVNNVRVNRLNTRNNNEILRNNELEAYLEDAIETEIHLKQVSKAVDQDLKIAQSIQQSILLSELPEVPEVKIELRYNPLQAVGGDFFSFTPLKEGGLGFFIGDVSSHGITAALFLSLIKYATDRICRKYAHHPRDYIKNLNHELLNNMPMSFLTAIYGLFMTKENGKGVILKFTSAGHPQSIWYRKNTGDVKLLNTKGTLLGMFNDAEYEDLELELQKGDRIYLFTDGIPETFNKKLDQFTTERLSQIVVETNESSPELGHTLDVIIKELNRFRGNIDFRDDILIIAFEVLL
ncbi:PP2C family protein-serine/threonine phosphatase [Spirochaetota bacterium]